MLKNTPLTTLLILLLSGLLFIPFLGGMHLFDWDEINFAECAREMLVTGKYSLVQINFEPFWEKPPIFIWLQALSMKLFGINEFSARFPNAICGIATLLTLYLIGKKIYDYRFGLLWTVCYAGSLLPHLYFKSGIIDPWFNLFIFLSVYQFILFDNYHSSRALRQSQGLKYLLYSAILLALAVLTKGPAAIVIFGLTGLVYYLLQQFRNFPSAKHIGIFILILALVGGSWFLGLLLSGNKQIIHDFIVYQIRLFKTEDAGHGGPFYYHAVILLVGCFPMSIFALRAFKQSGYDTPYQKSVYQWMRILFWVVLILFSVVKTKIVHYSSLCYFPLSFLAAYTLLKLSNRNISLANWMRITLIVVGVLIGLILSIFPWVEQLKPWILKNISIQDSFAMANLQAVSYWAGWEKFIGPLFICWILYFAVKTKTETEYNQLLLFFTGTALFINLSIYAFPKKAEAYSQHAAIEFYKTIAKKDAYVSTLGFKSYAHLFYSAKQAQDNPLHAQQQWLLTGKVDKPVYFVAKITEAQKIKLEYPQLLRIYSKNGFVFYIRKGTMLQP